MKQFKFMQVSQDITKDFPDISLRAGPNVIAGVLYVPLSTGGKDFIAFLRKGQLREVTWAGRANKSGGGAASLQPRTSFKVRLRFWPRVPLLPNTSYRRGRKLYQLVLELGLTSSWRRLVYWRWYMERYFLSNYRDVFRTEVCTHDTMLQFIDVWRQKETAVKATRLTNLLLSNASHEGKSIRRSNCTYCVSKCPRFPVRTPLNHIIK